LLPVGRRPHVATRLAGEVALGALLLAALAISWRDGVPAVDFVAPKMPTVAIVAAAGQGDTDALYSGMPMQLPPRLVPVPSAAPVRLLLPTLNLHPPVESVGLDRFGAMDVPNNIWDVGWYKSGPVPGAPGDAVIDGHAGYPGQPLIFGRLDKIRPGEPIVVMLADGTQQVFTVVSVASLPLNSMPPDMYMPYGPPRLTLITCDGQFDSNSDTYANRLVVEASYAGAGA
jgi:hypothetical protein